MNIVQRDVDQALKIARWFARRTPRADSGDIDSAALEGLALAANRWDGSTPFWKYASTRIIGAIRDELRRFDHLTRDQRDDFDHDTETIAGLPYVNPNKPLALNATTRTPDGDVAEVQELIADPHSDQDDRELWDTITRAFADLPERDRTIVFLVDVAGAQGVDVARELGIHESRVSQIRSAAHKHARDQIGESLRDAA